jgi:hypothetical protein
VFDQLVFGCALSLVTLRIGAFFNGILELTLFGSLSRKESDKKQYQT